MILYVGLHKTVTNSHETVNNLLQTIFTNGFPRLEICMVFDIGLVVFNDTWTGSHSLHILNLFMPHPFHREKLRSICPRLHRFTNCRFSTNDPSLSPGNSFIFIIIKNQSISESISYTYN